MTSLEDKARGKGGRGGGRTVAAIKVVVQQSRNNSRFNDILSVMYCTKGQFQGDPTIHICYMSPGLLSSELWACPGEVPRTHTGPAILVRALPWSAGEGRAGTGMDVAGYFKRPLSEPQNVLSKHNHSARHGDRWFSLGLCGFELCNLFFYK